MAVAPDQIDWTFLKHPEGKEYGVGVVHTGGAFFVLTTWGKEVYADASSGQFKLEGPWKRESSARHAANKKNAEKRNRGYEPDVATTRSARYLAPRVQAKINDLLVAMRGIDPNLGTTMHEQAEAYSMPPLDAGDGGLSWALSTPSQSALEWLLGARSTLKHQLMEVESKRLDLTSELEIIEAGIRAKS